MRCGIVGLIFGGLGGECAYTLQPNASAGFPHVNQPFTQGFEALVKKDCGNIGTRLDHCLEEPNNPPQCLETILEECVSLYESSGLYGESYVQIIRDFSSGTPAIRSKLPQDIFAEGLTVLNNGEILVGSWREKRLIVLQEAPNGKGLRYLREYLIQDPPELWGLAHSDDTLWITAGDQYLYSYKLPLRGVSSRGRSRVGPGRLPVQELKYDKKIPLRCNNRPLSQVNEIEYNPYTETLWGNVWMRHSLYEFDIKTGECINVLPLSKIRLFPDSPQSRSRRSRGLPDHDKVWNGVTFLSDTWLLFTGKLFDYVYLGKLIQD